jgi:hypothetical protein
MNKITFIIPLFSMFSFVCISCNNDNENPTPTSELYLRANINGTAWQADENTITAYISSNNTANIAGSTIVGSRLISFSAKNVTDTGTYPIEFMSFSDGSALFTIDRPSSVGSGTIRVTSIQSTGPSPLDQKVIKGTFNATAVGIGSITRVFTNGEFSETVN